MLPPKWCHVDLALICHFLVLDPHLKAIGLIYGSHPIGLLYFIGPWTLDHHQKWPLLWRWMMMICWCCWWSHCGWWWCVDVVDDHIVDDDDDDVLMLLMIILWMMMMMMMCWWSYCGWWWWWWCCCGRTWFSQLVELGIWNTNSRQLTVCFALVDGEEICWWEWGNLSATRCGGAGRGEGGSGVGGTWGCSRRNDHGCCCCCCYCWMNLERKKIIPCRVWIAKEIRNVPLDDADSTRRGKTVRGRLWFSFPEDAKLHNTRWR
jgi:hypothetical protein